MKNIPKILIIPFLLILIISCNLEPKQTGTIILNFPMTQGKTLLPAISINPVSYDISGAGPNGSAFNTNSDQTSIEIAVLEFGEWTVTVNAKNIDGGIIGYGKGTITIHSGETAILDIIVNPFEGNGTLYLTVTWNTDSIIKFFPDGNVRSILDHVQSQHFAAVHGDYVDELVDLCHLIGIKAVLDVD